MYKSLLVTGLAVLLMLGAAPALADQSAAPQQRPPEQASQAAPISGQLVSINADAKTLTVKPEEGAEVTFQYDDSTEVSGAKDGAAGLATMTNRRVVVHYREDAASQLKVATRIIVQPEQ